MAVRIFLRNLVCVFAFLFWCGSSIAALKPDGWITDTAGVIDDQSRAEITRVIQEIEQKTSAEIAVVTVPKLERNETIESFAVQLYAAWGIGKKGKDNGVLLLTAVDDRKIRIEVGYGLEGILPDGKCGEILDRFVIPEFKTGAYGRGLALGTRALASVIARDAGVEINGQLPVQPAGKQSPLQTAFSIIMLVFLFFLFIRHPFLFLLLLSGGRGGGGSGGRGGFGGFGGGMSGGGGASRGW